jgi:hypothetical protein
LSKDQETHLPDVDMEQAAALDQILRDLFDELDAFLTRQANAPIAGQDEACAGCTDADLEVIRRLRDNIRRNIAELEVNRPRPPQPETADGVSATGSGAQTRLSNEGTP